MRLTKCAYSLIEVLIVIIIIGIVAALGIANYTKVKTEALSKEAKASLKLIRAAERIYYLEVGTWFVSSNLETINSNIRVQLPLADSRNWDYEILSSECANAKRNVSPLDSTQNWRIRLNSEEPDGPGLSCP